MSISLSKIKLTPLSESSLEIPALKLVKFVGKRGRLSIERLKNSNRVHDIPSVQQSIRACERKCSRRGKSACSRLLALLARNGYTRSARDSAFSSGISIYIN